jgi:prephenate dehydrogenase
MRIAVVGLGVMGGSLARALIRRADETAAGPDSSPEAAGETVVTGWASDPADRAAAAAAGVDVRDGLGDAVAEADLVVLATPLSALPGLAAALSTDLADLVAPHSVITDVASLQAPALEIAGAVGLSDRWVTSHPLAGSERSGFAASRTDLYDAVPVFLSAGPDSALHARPAVAELWEAAGAVPEWIDPAVHDERMSLVSHLPQLASTALADAMAGAGLAAAALGPGGRDATRLAGSSPTMWRDLLTHARPTLVAAMRDLARRLGEDASALERGEVDGPIARLERAGAWRAGTREVES